MIKLNKQGFTLIELLVVIAIIGILASIVLVSLNSARQKGYDTQVKSDMSQARNLIEMCYDNASGTYDGCIDGVGDAAAYKVTLNTPPACSVGYAGNDAGTAWALAGGLCSTANFWCVDSTGVSKVIGAALGTDVTVCP